MVGFRRSPGNDSFDVSWLRAEAQMLKAGGQVWATSSSRVSARHWRPSVYAQGGSSPLAKEKSWTSYPRS